MANAGEVEINVTSNTASVEQGFARLGEVIGRFRQDATKNFETFQSKMEGIQKGFQSIVTVVTTGFAVHWFQNLIEGAIEAQAHLQDLADKVGTTAEKLSALIPAARLSGTSLDDIGTASIKFSRNLTEIQSGGGKAAEVFKALGFNAKDAARFLQDPTQGMFELAKALEKFATDGNKTAGVIELLGKSGANLIPFLKQLAEQGQLTARVTNEQAYRAKQLQDEWETMKLRSEDLRNSLATGLVPAFRSMLAAFDEAASKGGGFSKTMQELAANGQLTIWALQVAKAIAIVVEVFITLGKTLGVFVEWAQVAAKALLGLATVAANLAGGDVKGALQAFDAQILSLSTDVQTATASTKALWNDSATVVSDAIGKQIEMLRRGQTAYAQWAENSDRIDRALRGAPGGADLSDKAKPSLPDVAQLDKLNSELDKFRQMAAEARSELRALLSGDTFTPAQKALEQLKASDAWKGFNEGARKAIENMAGVASASQKTLDIQKKFSALVVELDTAEGDYAKDFAAKFKVLTDAFNAGAKDIDGTRLSLERYRELTNDLLKQQPFAKAQREELERMVKAMSDAFTELTKLQGQNQVQLADYTLQTKELEKQNDLLLLDDRTRTAILATMEMQALRQRLINAGQDNLVESLDKEIAKREQAALRAYDLNKAIESQKQILSDLTNATADFFKDFFENGSSAFKRLWDRFKAWALEALAKIAAQQIIVQLGGQLNLSGNALSAVGGGNPLSSLLGLASGGTGGAGSLASLLGVGGGAYGAAAGAGAAAGVETLSIAASAGAEAVGGFAAVAGAAAATLGVAIPILGAAIIAYELIMANKEPAQVRGQFGISPTPTGFEDQVSTATRFGFAGFLDAMTQQFSGEAAKVFDDIVSGALDAFASRMTGPQQDRLAEILQETTFGAFEGTFSTEDFLQKYGGQVLQQVIVAAFNVLDPALASVAASFEGTADEVAKFGNTLLSIYDVSADFSDTFKGNIAAALAGATQAVADKILAFVTIVSGVGAAFESLGAQLQELDPASMLAFVDALGGAQSALQSFNYLIDNFTTSADKMNRQTEALSNAFEALGVGVPQTHQQFLDLLDSFDLTTAEGRDLYAAVLKLSSAFIAVHGTADAAAQAVNAQAEANQQLVEYFQTHFYSETEQSASRVAAATASVNAVQAQYIEQLHALGADAIPRTMEGFRALVEAVEALGPAGSDLLNALLGLAPAIVDINGATTDLAASASSAATTIADAAQAINLAIQEAQDAASQLADQFQGALRAIDDIVGQSGGGPGDKLALRIQLLTSQYHLYEQQLAQIMQTDPYGPVANNLRAFLQQLSGMVQMTTADLARFTVLRAQYGETIAGQLLDLEHWYNSQAALLAGNADALAALHDIFEQRWQDIINGVHDGVGDTQDELARLRQSIKDWLQGLTVGNLSPLSPFQRFQEAQRQFQEQLALAQHGDTTALSNITHFADTYLQLAHDAFASGPQYTQIFEAVQHALELLATPPPSPDDHQTNLLGPPLTLTEQLNTTLAPPLLALSDVLPVGGAKLASDVDTQQVHEDLGDLREAIAALAEIIEHQSNKQITSHDKGVLTITDTMRRGSK